jgi:transposase
MIQLVPHLRILLAISPVDFRKGAETLAAFCQKHLSEDPYSGTLFVFRNRRGTALKLLIYDGVGWWARLAPLLARKAALVAARDR